MIRPAITKVLKFQNLDDTFEGQNAFFYARASSKHILRNTRNRAKSMDISLRTNSCKEDKARNLTFEPGAPGSNCSPVTLQAQSR